MIVNYHLVRWPCGCVLSFGDPLVHADWHLCYQCPWCDAVVSRQDLLKWFNEGESLPIVVANYHQLIQIDRESPIEVVGISYDGEPIVRERYCGAKPHRLGVPPDVVEVLRN